MTPRLAVLAELTAKPGKETELVSLLEAGRDLAAQEAGTTTWFAFKIDESRYGIFDTFASEDAREAHLTGPIAQALGEAAPHLLAKDPEILKVDVIAAK